MGLHTDLRIYSAAAKLLDAVSDGAFQMRRDAKPLLGKKLIEECLDITTLIQQANTEKDKTPYLNLLLQKKSRVEALLKVAVDRGRFTTGHYAIAAQHAVDLGKQAIGWRNSQQRQLHDRQGGHASA